MELALLGTFTPWSESSILGTFGPAGESSLKLSLPRAKVLVMYNFVTFATWIQSRLWPAKSLTAFQSLVRTNNDVEG